MLYKNDACAEQHLAERGQTQPQQAARKLYTTRVRRRSRFDEERRRDPLRGLCRHRSRGASATSRARGRSCFAARTRGRASRIRCLERDRELPVAPELEVRVHQPRDDESVLRADAVRGGRRGFARQGQVHLGRVDEGRRRRDDQRLQRGGQRQGRRNRRLRGRQGSLRGTDQARALEGDPGAVLQRRWSAGRREGTDGLHRPGAVRVGLFHGPEDRNARSRRATWHCSSPRPVR